MDDYGNLTDVSEFSNGRRIRLISPEPGRGAGSACLLAAATGGG